ncbi:MAG: serine acetyltransferase [Bacteroidota bacterium]
MADQKLISAIVAQSKICGNKIPDKKQSHAFADDLFQFLFGCGNQIPGDVEQVLTVKYQTLQNQLATILNFFIHDTAKVDKEVSAFFESLNDIYHKVKKDADAVVNFDPAAESIEEVMAAYPGIYSIAIYRIAHQLHKQGIKTLPRLLGEYAHSVTGIDIHPAAVIGQSFFIDHGTGIVIGGTTIIGDNVKIYQGVTLGALNVAKELARTKRHPTIEDNVIIYSGATILGGATVVGHDSVIGGNVWLTNSVPSNSVVYQKSEVTVRDKNPMPDPSNFVI